jgi:hypothetical protein
MSGLEIAWRRGKPLPKSLGVAVGVGGYVADVLTVIGESVVDDEAAENILWSCDRGMYRRTGGRYVQWASLPRASSTVKTANALHFMMMSASVSTEASFARSSFCTAAYSRTEYLVTPVTIEGLSSLHNLIKEDDCTSERLQRRVQKLASAAQISFAKQHLLQDHKRLLAKINGEAKVRRSTKSVVLGKAKVMSFEDLEVTRVKRATKDKATADKGKGKRGRKRKNPAPEVDETEVMRSYR